MEQEEPGDGQLTPSELCRRRRKTISPKYLNDYESDDKNICNDRQEAQRRSPKVKGSNSQSKTHDEEERKKNNQTLNSGTEKPKKRGRPRKCPVKEENTATNGRNCIPGGGRDAADAAAGQPENGTPKPKRKYVKKQQKNPDPPPDEAAEEPPSEAGEEPEPGGRRRRGAAKAALKYLTLLAKEVLSHPSDDPESNSHPRKEDSRSERQTPKERKGKGRKRKHADSDASEDEDFVPEAEEEVDQIEEEEEEEEKEEEEAEDSETDSGTAVHERSPALKKSYTTVSGKLHNGLPLGVIKSIWEAAETYRKFREEHLSSWVFPEWVPSTLDWNAVPESGLDQYLPQELQSAAFKVSREGLTKEDSPQLRLSRFQSLAAHSECWDMFLFCGGPVWALEWCPTPDGAPSSQYIALACHAGMDDLHPVTQTSSGPGLVQLWDCGGLEYNCRPDSPPALVYGLAQDKGFIWCLKWCPSGAWELPTSNRKAPLLPRLGLLAVASSSGVVSIYSLPHPDALLCINQLTTRENKNPPIFKGHAVVTLKLGSIKSPRHEQSGMVLSLDWLPQKPHNVMAVGFYDGVVGLWDLTAKSALLRVVESDSSVTLLPHRCFLAHDHCVRALAFCPASRHLLATAGEDRQVKMWDLRRLFDPLSVQKRFLTNEICWPLTAPGLLIGQDCAFVAKGNQGIHFLGLSTPSYFAIPRNTSVWSMSYSEWLNCVLSADVLGELILSVLPQLDNSGSFVKRNILRRFPVCFTSMVPWEEKEETAEMEEEGGVGAEQEELSKKPNKSPDGGNEGEYEEVQREKGLHLQFETYKEAVQKYFLHYADSNVKNLGNVEKRGPWKRMKNTESTAKANIDENTLAALHKVRFSPNMRSHVWLASGGQAGLVRLHCLRSLIGPDAKKMVQESQSHFSALHSAHNHTETPTEQP